MHYFKINLGLKTESVTKNNLKDAFKATDMRLSDEEFNYVIRFLFNISKDLTQLHYLRIFDMLAEKHKQMHPTLAASQLK